MTNKIAIFSDIHGNLQALESIAKDIKEKQINSVYCLGDVIGIGPNPKECLDLIIDNSINMVCKYLHDQNFLKHLLPTRSYLHLKTINYHYH